MKYNVDELSKMDYTRIECVLRVIPVFNAFRILTN